MFPEMVSLHSLAGRAAAVAHVVVAQRTPALGTLDEPRAAGLDFLEALVVVAERQLDDGADGRGGHGGDADEQREVDFDKSPDDQRQDCGAEAGDARDDVVLLDLGHVGLLLLAQFLVEVAHISELEVVVVGRQHVVGHEGERLGVLGAEADHVGRPYAAGHHAAEVARVVAHVHAVARIALEVLDEPLAAVGVDGQAGVLSVDISEIVFDFKRLLARAADDI